ncbi:MAG: tail-specific protease [Parachlamydia sp.]|nr:MAG: tail-specific protease [Parachlamydia sp.]
MQVFKPFFFVLIFTTSLLFSAERELLKTADVNKVMQEILRQHVSQKQMSDQILKTSLKVYIDQFDPERLYLLQNEIAPFLNMNDAQASLLLQQYSQNDFAAYMRLNSVIQNSITRARKIRQELIQRPQQLFLYQNPSQYKADKNFGEEIDLSKPFSQNPGELRNRIKHQLIRFIGNEIEQHGIAKIRKNENAILAFYENRMREKENKYLLRNASGHPLSEEEKENFLVMHILKALTRSLDAHTTFYDAVEAYDMKVRLEKGVIGVGLIPQETDNGITISKIIPDSPASKSGVVQVDDQIVSIDGKDVSLQTFDQVMSRLQSNPGTLISLVLKKPNTADNNYAGSSYQLSLRSEAIPINEGRVEIAYQPFEKGVLGVITLHSFYQGINGINSELDVRNALKELVKQGPLRGLILDLRENSGGFLSQAVRVAGLFITNGVIVISKYSNGEERFYRDMDGKSYYNGPLIVLTSKATASAAEIVAQALQDYGVALVIGDEQTYGKGTIQSQTVTENKGSSFFKVTVGKYYTVSGKTPQIEGVKADIVVSSQFLNDNIGEEYLEYPLTHDKISSAYEDLLEDIDTSLKPWYLQYYTPTLQNKVHIWRSMLPVLRRNSAARLANNPQYQQFLKGQTPAAVKKTEIPFSEGSDPDAQDMQLTEALNILKDMIHLRKNVPHPKQSLYVEQKKREKQTK